MCDTRFMLKYYLFSSSFSPILGFLIENDAFSLKKKDVRRKSRENSKES